MKLFALIFVAIFLAHSKSDFASEKLKSWINVISCNLKKDDASGKVTGAVIQTDSKLLETIEFALNDHRDTLHSARVKSSISLCLFEGYVKYSNKVDLSSPVRMKFCRNEFSGLFSYYGVVYTMLTRDRDGSWIIFTSSDKIENATGQDKSCKSVDYNQTKIYGKPLEKPIGKLEEKLSVPRNSREKRSALMHRRNYIEIMMFVSDEFYRDKGSSDETVIEKSIEVVHLADFYYAAIPEANLHLSLVDVMIWRTPAEDICNNTSYYYETVDCLEDFMRWHYWNRESLPEHDNAMYITTQDFYDSGTLGIAYLQTVCTMDGSGSLTREDYSYQEQFAATLAHELGHNLGLMHNFYATDPRCACQADACLMDASASTVTPQMMTVCQQETVKEFIQHGASQCLHNEPEKQVDVSYCGDYLVNQDWEECDCGSVETCEDPCCNPVNCTLVQGASCSGMDLCCDSSTCSVRPQGFVCRKETSDCDVAEICNGTSTECPNDEVKRAGLQCEIHGLPGHCLYGYCSSHYSQCKWILEERGMFYSLRVENETDDFCWDLNREGTERGNCGVSPEGHLIPCTLANQKCGKLQCSWDWEASSYDASDIEQWNSYDWFTGTPNGDEMCVSLASYIVSDDIPHDYSYVNDGTWCDEDSFCHDKTCTHISKIPGLTECPQNCNGRGNCKPGQGCECDKGYYGNSCENEGEEERPPTMSEIFAGAILAGVKSIWNVFSGDKRYDD